MTTSITKSALGAIVKDMPLKHRVINYFTVPFGYVSYPRYPYMEMLGAMNPWEARLRGEKA